MSAVSTSITAATTGETSTPLQYATQAASMPFCSSPQPSHLPDMGMSLLPDMGMSLLAAAIADLRPTSRFATLWVTRPTAKARASNTADIRRIFPDHIAAK